MQEGGGVGKKRGPLSFLPSSWKQVMEPGDPLQQGLTDCSGLCRWGQEGGLLELFLSRSSKMKPSVSPTGLPFSEEEEVRTLWRRRGLSVAPDSDKKKVKIPEVL